MAKQSFEAKVVINLAATVFYTFVVMTGMVAVLWVIGLFVTFSFGPSWLLDYLRNWPSRRNIILFGAYLTLPGLIFQHICHKWKCPPLNGLFR